MISQSVDFPHRYMADLLLKGQVIPFLGPGASLASRFTNEWRDESTDFLPTGLELARIFAAEEGFPSDEFGPNPPTLMEVAEYIVNSFDRAYLYSKLYDVFDRDFELSSIHRLLAEIPIPLVIVTTNYDDLIERAFAEAGRQYDVVFTALDRLGSDISVAWWKHNSPEPIPVTPDRQFVDLSETSVIYKMHGTVDRRRGEWDSYLVTEADYIDFIFRMGAGTALPEQLVQHFTTRHFLFLGYSLRDWDVRLLFSILANRTRPIKRSWAVLKYPSKFDVLWWKQRGVDIYDVDIVEFVERLHSEISELRTEELYQPVDSAAADVKTHAQESLPMVFISYAREDEREVAEIYDALKNHGFRPWLDREEILPGERWEPKIRQSLKESDFLVICLSSNSVRKRGYVQREMKMALDLALEMPPDSIFLIPVRLDEVEVPDDLAEYQYMDWYAEEAPKRLVDAISAGWQRRLS